MLVASARPAKRQGQKALPDCAAACPELSLRRWSQISLIAQPRIPMGILRHGRSASHIEGSWLQSCYLFNTCIAMRLRECGRV
jgi:hypothetical protein